MRVFRFSTRQAVCLMGLVLIGAGPWSGGGQLARADEAPPAIQAVPAVLPPADDKPDEDDATADPAAKTPEQKMQARYPQPIRVGDLIGQPVLDGDHATIGFVQRVVRAGDGKIKLIVPYRTWLAWAQFLGGYDARPVAVPLEVVGSMGPALSSIDMDREDYGQAPTWHPGVDKDIPPDETIGIAIARE